MGDEPIIDPVNRVAPEDKSLADLQRKKAPSRINLDEHQYLHTALKDRLSAPINEYREGVATKADGATTGFIGTTKENSMYMVKPSNLDRVQVYDEESELEYFEKRDVMQEYIASGIYKRVLYDRAATIGLADVSNSTNLDDKNKLYIKSKFFEGFQDLNSVKRNSSKDLEGFEKVIAACLFAGEVDYHGENLGVVDNKVVKIDHGQSGMRFFNNEVALRRSLQNSIYRYGYTKIPLSTEALRNSINEISQISSDEIEKIVASRIDNLKKSGFKLEDNIVYVDGNGREITKRIDSYADLEEFYVTQYKQQQQVLQNFSNTIDIISRIEYSKDPAQQKKWQSGQWIQDIGAEDPVKWAIRNNCKIEGIDLTPQIREANKKIAWAIANNQKIDKINPLVWALDYGRKIEEKHPIVWAMENNRKIEGREALDWAIENNQKIEKTDPIVWAIANNIEIEGKEPLNWAMENNKKIDGKDPLNWAIENRIEIEGKHPLNWAIDNQIKIEGKHPVVWAVENNIEIEDANLLALVQGGDKKIAWAIANEEKIEDKDPVVWAMDNMLLIAEVDPIEYAMNSNYKIEGKEPLDWAIENNKQIDELDAFEWAVRTGSQLDGKDSVVWGMENDKKIRGLDVLEWAGRNTCPIEGENPIIWATKNDKKIEGKHPVVWAIENHIEIEDQDPIDYIKGLETSDPVLFEKLNKGLREHQVEAKRVIDVEGARRKSELLQEQSGDMARGGASPTSVANLRSNTSGKARG
jgi:hypothetical protein